MRINAFPGSYKMEAYHDDSNNYNNYKNCSYKLVLNQLVTLQP